MDTPSRLGHLPVEVASAVGMLREVAGLPEGHPKAISLRRVAFRLLVAQFRSLGGVSAKLRKERAEIVAGRLADASPSSDLLPEIAEAICWLMYCQPSKGDSVFGIRKEKARKASWVAPANKETSRPAPRQASEEPSAHIAASDEEEESPPRNYSPEDLLDHYFPAGDEQPKSSAPRRRG